MTEHRFSVAHVCPACLKEMDAAVCLSNDDRLPKAGDITVCAYCGNVLVFTDTRDVITATGEEIQKLPEKLRVALAMTIGFVKYRATKLNEASKR